MADTFKDYDDYDISSFRSGWDVTKRRGYWYAEHRSRMQGELSGERWRRPARPDETAETAYNELMIDIIGKWYEQRVRIQAGEWTRTRVGKRVW